MIRFLFVFIGAIGLILLAAAVAPRILRVRTEGVSVGIQVFVALALIVGAFAFGLGLLVLDRIEARATRLATETAHDEARVIATFVAGQIDSTGMSLQDVVQALEIEDKQDTQRRSRLTLYDASGAPCHADGADSPGPGTVAVRAPIRTRTGVVGQVQVVKETVIMRRMLADFAPTVLMISSVLGIAAAFAAALIGRAIARPIAALTLYAEKVSEGDRKVTPPQAHGREVKRLTKAIDRMRRELDGLPYVESFAADLSHELKNPVAAIRASAEVLDDGALAEPEQAARFVKRIREATQRVEAIVSELLSLARIESRGVDNPEVVDIAGLVKASIEANVSRGAVALHSTTQPLKVRGDATLLGRAIDNLINNALTHGDGAIDSIGETESTPSPGATVTLRQQGNQVLVSVTNRGVIPAHLKQRLFRRFVTSRGEKGGTGLGLPIARAVAEAHGGSITLDEPSAGNGTITFCLMLPKA